MAQDNVSPRWVQETIKILRRADFYLCIIAGVAMFFIMLLTVADVIGRSFFTWPITGTYELSRYALVVMVLLGIGYVQQGNQHIAVDLFVKKLSRSGQFVTEIIGTLMGLGFSLLVSWQGWRGGLESMHNKTVSDTLHIPAYPFEFLIGLGATFLSIELIIKVVTLRMGKADN